MQALYRTSSLLGINGGFPWNISYIRYISSRTLISGTIKACDTFHLILLSLDSSSPVDNDVWQCSFICPSERPTANRVSYYTPDSRYSLSLYPGGVAGRLPCLTSNTFFVCYRLYRFDLSLFLSWYIQSSVLTVVHQTKNMFLIMKKFHSRETMTKSLWKLFAISVCLK